MHHSAFAMRSCSLRSLSPATLVILLSSLKCLVSGDQQEVYEGSLIHAQFSADPHLLSNKTSLVLDGTLQLAGCGISQIPNSSVNDFECYYCELGEDTWAAQQLDPSLLPSFRDMLGESIHCSDHAYLFNLKDIVATARNYDEVNSIPVGKVKGVIMSQPSSGSSVLMNAIIVAEGKKSRTHADHPAIIEVLDACDNLNDNLCDFEDHVSAMVDLIYLLSRRESDIFIKLNPHSSANIKVLREALHDEKDVKWAYVQRGADEVLTKATERKRNGCLKNRNNPSKGLLTFVQNKGYDDLKDFTDEEVCSAFFAYNHQTAVNEFSTEDPNTIIMDYDSSIKNKDQLRTHVTDFFEIDLADNALSARVTAIVQKETHSRGGSRRKNVFVDEAQREGFTALVKSANAKFLGAVGPP